MADADDLTPAQPKPAGRMQALIDALRRKKPVDATQAAGQAVRSAPAMADYQRRQAAALQDDDQ